MLNWLLLFVPAAIGLEFLSPGSQTLIFIVSCLAIVPLAGWLGRATEELAMPYTLEGTVRAFNQELLDKDLIEEQLLFFTFEKEGGMWRFFDARTYRSGPFDREYLVTLMEQLI